jgi:hypothetical protein
MIKGCPILALERGKQLSTPPTLCLQLSADIVHDSHDQSSGQTLNELERFVKNNRNAGGEIEIIHIDQVTRSGAPAFKYLIPFLN